MALFSKIHSRNYCPKDTKAEAVRHNDDVDRNGVGAGGWAVILLHKTAKL